MDHARKIGKSQEPIKWESRPSPCATSCDGLISKDPPIVEDKKFVNWKKWLIDRKNVCGRIKSATGRDQTEQLMNSCETVRPLIEMRNLMDYANTPAPTIPDKFRGGPEFWRIPEALPDKDPHHPQITVAMNKKELNLMPDLMYVGMPEIIEKEKDLTGLKGKDHFWKRSKYLKKRKEELRKEIEVLQTKEPEMEGLVVQGQAFKEKPRMLRIPPITISAPEDDNSCDDLDLAIVLKIQNREIVWDRSSFLPENNDPSPEPIIWSLTFDGIVDERSEKIIRLENKGTRAIAYQWRDGNFKSKLFSLERRFSPFYFNKNKELILPGQIVELRVWYLPRNPGIFTETWNLLTDVRLSPSLLQFRFWGCAIESDNLSVRKEFDPGKIEVLLDHRTRDSAIREILDEIINCLNCSQHPEPTYGSLFLEADIFRAKNPFHHYHPDLTIEFRKLYRSVVDENAPSWNLSAMDLRQIILRINDPDFRNERLRHFNFLAKESLKPTFHTSSEDRKYEMAYAALCSLANQIEMESDFILSTTAREEVTRESYENSEPEVAKSGSTSALSIKSSASKGRRGRRGSRKMSISQDPSQPLDVDKDKDQAYGEILFVRVYQALSDTVGRVCAIIDSFNRLNVPDK